MTCPAEPTNETPVGEAGAMPFAVRKWVVHEEQVLATERGAGADGKPLVKLAVAATVRNPYAGIFRADLGDIVRGSALLGTEFARRLLRQLRQREIQSYGKACIVGANGEYEHGNAFLTTAFADPLRGALGGGKAWIPSTGKIGCPGASIDVPLACKDALYVRSHYDTLTLGFSDAPAADEIVVIFACATRGRLNARLGGLTLEQVSGDDGLV